MATVYVNTDVAAAGGDGSLGNPYKTLAEALTPYRLAGVTTTPVTIRCSGATADPGVSGLGSAYSLDHTVWDFVTSPTNYIEIIGDNATGKWNSAAYHIDVTNRSGIYNNLAAHVRLHNLQLQVKITDGGTYNGYRLSTANNDLTNGAGSFLYKNCIGRRDPTSTNGKLNLWIDSVLGDPVPAGTLNRINCLAIGGYGGTGATDEGFVTDSSAWVIANLKNYNCLAAKCWIAYDSYAVSINCAATACLLASAGPDAAGTDYCANDDGNGFGGSGTHNRIGTTFDFVDAANGDYRLTANDAGGRNFGTDLSGTFPDDILGAIRTGTWDIGPFEQGALVPAVATGGYAGWQGGVLSVGF